MQASDDSRMAEQTLREKQEFVRQQFPTIFSATESRTFLGHSLIQNSVFETSRERKDELVAKALEILSHMPETIDLAQVVPSLAKNQQLVQIVRVCLVKYGYFIRMAESRADDAKDMLEIIVQVVDALDRSIDTSAKGPVDSSGFMHDLEKAVQKMTLEIKLQLRTNIISMLINSEGSEPEAHLLRAFLVKRREVDFICEKMQPALIEKECFDFIHRQSANKVLT